MAEVPLFVLKVESKNLLRASLGVGVLDLLTEIYALIPAGGIASPSTLSFIVADALSPTYDPTASDRFASFPASPSSRRRVYTVVFASSSCFFLLVVEHF